MTNPNTPLATETRPSLLEIGVDIHGAMRAGHQARQGGWGTKQNRRLRAVVSYRDAVRVCEATLAERPDLTPADRLWLVDQRDAALELLVEILGLPASRVMEGGA